jgi:hypothetical protein
MLMLTTTKKQMKTESPIKTLFIVKEIPYLPIGGAEGLQAQNGEHLLLCDSISDIIEGVNALWSDIHLSQNLTLSAYNLVKTTYSWQAVAQNIEDAIKQLFLTYF